MKVVLVDSHVSIPEAQVRSIANHVRPDRQSKLQNYSQKCIVVIKTLLNIVLRGKNDIPP